jgi:hypothetical protein
VGNWGRLDELRFHLGASNFSARVYRHLELAVRYLPTVTVETPAWPPHRTKLFEMLPILADVGVRHLNLGQVEVNAYNLAAIAQAYPDAEFFQVFLYQMDDGGLVYDLMREVLARGYRYSVLDCNGLVKAVQRASDGGVLMRQVAYDGTDLEGMVDFAAWRTKR